MPILLGTQYWPAYFVHSVAQCHQSQSLVSFSIQKFEFHPLDRVDQRGVAEVIGSKLDFIAVFAELRGLHHDACATYEDVETIVLEVLDARFRRFEG